MEKSRMLVSIIMSCYNEKIEWIKASIDSILNQTYENIELIIICDNPQYEELKIVLNEYQKNNKNIRVIYNNNNIGLTKSLNLAIKLCNGEIIARMDSDDISDIDRIRKQIEYMSENQLDFVMSGAYFMNEKGTVISKSCTYSCEIDNIIKSLKYGNTSIHPTWLFKKKILDKIIEYNDIEYAEDYDFLCRVVLNGYKIGCIQEPLLTYRRRKNGITKSKRVQQEINAQIIGRCYRNHLMGRETYNPIYYQEKVKVEDIESNIILDNEFKVGKEEFIQRKMIKGIYKMIKILFKSKLKRVQLINYIKIRKMYKEELIIQRKGI